KGWSYRVVLDGGSIDYATIKYSGDGVPQWTNRFNGPGNGPDYAYARLYAVLQASMENVLQNHGSLPLNLNGHGERRHIIRALRGDQNRSTWACSRKQRKLLRRFSAKCNLDWSFIERAAQERFAKPVQALNQSQARELIRVLHE